MDHEKARVDYVTGRMTYSQIAEKYGVSRSHVGAVAKKEGWKKQRDAFRKSVTDKAVTRLADRGAAQLERMMDTADRLNGVLSRITEDKAQFFRWKGSGEDEGPQEYVLNKADTKALKNATAALFEMVRITRNLYGIPDRMEDRKDRREERRVKLAESQAGNVSESQAGIVLMPQILDSEPEDAPEVNG